MTITLVVLNVAVLVLLAGVVWATMRPYRPRLSAIERELGALTGRLDQLPGDSGLREQLSAHERLLRGLGEQLRSHPDAELLHRYLQDHTNQLLAILSTDDSGEKKTLTRTDFEDSLQLTNQKLERVLWALRFDEEKYQQSAEARKDRRQNSRNSGNTNEPDRANAIAPACDDRDVALLTNSLNDGGDSYQAMLDYMKTTGKSGADALHALEMARVMHSR